MEFLAIGAVDVGKHGDIGFDYAGRARDNEVIDGQFPDQFCPVGGPAAFCDIDHSIPMFDRVDVRYEKRFSITGDVSFSSVSQFDCVIPRNSTSKDRLGAKARKELL